MFYPSFITNKTERFSFKSGSVVQVAKHLKVDWFIVLLNNYGLKSCIANVLKCKARLKPKFKCVCVTMCSLVMSPFSLDCVKTGNRLIKVLAMFN